MKKYTTKDFLSFASAFDYSDDLGIVENEKLHKEMKNWNLKKFQEFYGFTHKDDKTGEDITKKGEKMIEKTDHIYNTALAYACYKSGPKRVDEHLLKQMFNDLCLLSEEYAFDYKQELKKIIKK